MRVKVYFNLHKKCLSVMAVEGERKGRVIAHVDAITLKNVQFLVSETGRQRVLNLKRKNVHAFIVGEWDGDAPDDNTICSKAIDLVTYNPYKYNSFVFKSSEQPVFKASLVKVEGKAIWAA